MRIGLSSVVEGLFGHTNRAGFGHHHLSLVSPMASYYFRALGPELSDFWYPHLQITYFVSLLS